MRIAESCSWSEAICLLSVMMTERYITPSPLGRARDVWMRVKTTEHNWSSLPQGITVGFVNLKL